MISLKLFLTQPYAGDQFLEPFFVSIDQCVCGFSFITKEAGTENNNLFAIKYFLLDL